MAGLLNVSGVRRRGFHYLLIVLVWSAVCLPNLGGPSLWDIDEGNNSEAAREMLVSGNWIVPYFNYNLRVDKPVLLYWCQVLAFESFGVNEFAARFPSALAVLLTALTTYELALAMFGVGAALLAGVGVPTCLLACAAGHFANPDALLTLALTLAFTWFWVWYRGHSWAAWPLGLSVGLGILAKGPVALVLPLLVWSVFMLWQGRYWRLWRPDFIFGGGSWMIVALPWYVWVTVETHGRWLSGFWFQHNQGRFLTTMESHGGPVVYYLPVLLLGLAPWSLFLVHAVSQAVWHARRGVGPTDDDTVRRDATRYLLVWAAVYVGFFSLSATKLPNYVLPVYPALLILVADRLERWRQGETLPRWVMPTALALLAACAAALFLGAFLPVVTAIAPAVVWAILGALALLSFVLLGWHLHQRQATGFLISFVLLATLGTGVVVGWGGTQLEPHKAVKVLAQALPSDHLQREVRIVTYGYFQPSLVFYTQRLVEPLATLDAVVDALRSRQPVYLVLPRSHWEDLQARQPTLAREVAGRRDLYRRIEVVLVTNDPVNDLAARSRADSLSVRP